MNIPEEKLNEFQELYRKAFGKELPRQKAADMAEGLLVLLQSMVETMERKGGL